MFEDGEMLTDPMDPRRLGFLHPATVRYLLEQGTVVDHARYFPLCADLLCLTRSMSSRIPMDFDGKEYYECKKNLKPVFLRTLTTEFLPEEKAEQQYQHRDASLRFLKVIRASSRKNGGSGDERPIYPVAEMRELQITTASTKLRCFNDICKSLGKDTLTDSMNEYRLNGFDGWSFVRFLCEHTGTELPKTGLQYLQFICEGSPMIRALIKHICTKDFFLKPRKNGKLFVLEDTPLVAMFIHWTLNMMGINTALFHSGLDTSERNDLQDDFNDSSSEMDVMVCLYDVGGVGRNFHPDCYNAVLTTAGKNQAAETQGKGRLVRAPQKNAIVVTKIMVKNTIATYREYRKRDKAIIELATRASDPEIAAILVQCLNDHQEVIRSAQADPKNQELMEKLAVRKEVAQEQTVLLARTVPDKLDLVKNQILEGKRTRKAVERYRDEDYDEVTGEYIGDREGEDDGDDNEELVQDGQEFNNGDGEGDGSQELGEPGPDEKEDDDGTFVAPDDDDEDGDWNYRSDEGNGEYDEDYLDLFSDEEDIPEEESETAKQKRKALKAARIAMRNENQEDEGLRRLGALLSADPHRIYTHEDLKKATTLKRALELAYCARSGTAYDTPTSIHIEVGYPKTSF
jgi:hypothetical protein